MASRNTPTEAPAARIPLHSPRGQAILARMLTYLSLAPTTSLHALDALDDAISQSPTLRANFTSTTIKTRSPRSSRHEGGLTLHSTPAAIVGRRNFMRDVQTIDIPERELASRAARPEPVRKVKEGEGLEERYAVLSCGELGQYSRQDAGTKCYRPTTISPLRKEVVCPLPSSERTPGRRLIPRRPVSVSELDSSSCAAISRIMPFVSFPLNTGNDRTVLAMRFRNTAMGRELIGTTTKTPPSFGPRSVLCTSAATVTARRACQADAKHVEWSGEDYAAARELRMRQGWRVQADVDNARRRRVMYASRGIARTDPPVMMSEVNDPQIDSRTRNRPGVKRRRLSLLRIEVFPEPEDGISDREDFYDEKNGRSPASLM